MIAHITACILALSTLGTAADGSIRYSLQLRTDRAALRAEWLAYAAADAASAHQVDPYLLIAVAWHESAFDRYRVSSLGARSIMQLMGRLGARYDHGCAATESPWACDWIAFALGAGELSRGLAECHDEAGALSWYSSGRCDLRGSWRVQNVLATRDEIKWGAP